MLLLQLHLHFFASIVVCDNLLLQKYGGGFLEISSPTQSERSSFWFFQDFLIVEVELRAIKIEGCDCGILGEGLQLFGASGIVNKNWQLSEDVCLDFQDIIRMDPEFV